MFLVAAANNSWGMSEPNGWGYGEMVFVVVVTLGLLWLAGWWQDWRNGR